MTVLTDNALQAAPVNKARGYWATVGRRIRRDRVSMACAAILLATRIFSMVSGALTSEPVNLAGPGLPTYSGRGIDAGTGRCGLTVPGVSVPVGAVEAKEGID